MEEHSRYVAQLKAEFDSCDTTETGFLDRDELTELCSRLQLDTHLDLLLDTLLGQHSRVNFEEFKEVFVSVLSRSLDFSTSEDDSSYLEPVVPVEVKPKFVKGTKRYGRRSRPDSTPGAALTCESEDSPPSRTEVSDSLPVGVRRAKLRRATSLESVESLKSDEEAGSQKESIQTHFQSEAHQQEEQEVGVDGGPHVLTAVCHHLGLQHLHAEEVDMLLRKLNADLDGRVSIREFKKVLCGSAPMTCSTPVRSADLQRAPHGSQTVLEEPGLSARSTSSLLGATVGQKVLSRLDDGSGSTSPDRVIALWTEEGIRNSRDILQMLDFPLEERLSLTDLTLALDNELLVSGSSIHQVALVSYRNEIQHLQEAADQACRERDKVKADLELADQRNLQLVREVDDRHASMETLNQTRIRDLEQDFRDRLTALRNQSELESETLLQQAERERSAMQEEVQLLRAQEAELQEELNVGKKENLRLDEELNSVKLQLNEAQSSVNKLQKDLDQLLHDKFDCLDPAGAGPSHEERISEIVREHELQCRKIKELQDRNDELSSEVELLKSQRRNRRSAGDNNNTTLSWRQQHSDSDDSDMKRSSSPSTRKKLQPADKTVLCSLDDVSSPAVSIQTELALEQLQQKHDQELQQLNIQLETQVNYYERSLDLMRQSMEVERKDISQAFKLEISELEEQKSEAEQQVKQLKDSLDKLQTQIQHGGGGGWSSEQQRRMQRERAELEQNFAREIGNLVQRLSAEKEQLEAELKLKMDQELLLVRTQLEEVRSENGAQQERLKVLQQEVQTLEDDVGKKRRRLEEMEKEHDRCREEEEKLHRENSRYRQEVLDLSSRNLQLSNDNAELTTRLRGDQESVRMLRERLATVSREQGEEEATVRRLQDAALQQEREKLQQQNSWTQEKQLLQKELSCCKEKVEKLQQRLVSLESEAELLRSQLLSVNQYAGGHAHEASELHRKLQEAHSKVEELEGGVRRLLREKEGLCQDLEQLRVQNQELQNQVSTLQVQKLNQEQQNLRSRQSVAEEQAQHLHQLEEQQRRSQQLVKTLKMQLQQSNSQISMKQDQYEKVMAALQQKVQHLEVKLKGVRLVLQEKVQQLKDQMVKSSKASVLLKDVYVENSQLVKALQVTEQRQKQAEKKNSLLEEKVGALNKLLREIVSASLTT